ncbi:HEPN domain-containing protein [Candidatus Thiodictyon syntrophicum]|jgi:HEPN domain-containing protein|uniref:HEPN domain-containing protein n=1 Tax=Candidatus Thiodictyon syntrophicum TaxID=1166950 RepID=A0A2K8UE01_9GAMM|nr:HEPN domain-containing protein [Candidatus Thiodictyon syntrophicum]AUB83707.1 hypothetical protein THSYN_23955 [Candidatus Thiodictyon syntrophicum]
MRRPDDPEVNDWLTKVAEDYRVAQLLAESAERLDDAICFHCQQAAEKLLKALLVAAGARPPRTHEAITIFWLSRKPIGRLTIRGVALRAAPRGG